MPTINMAPVSKTQRNLAARSSGMTNRPESQLPFKKDCYESNCVEVTVKTVGPNPHQKQRARSKTREIRDEPWGTVLRSQMSLDNMRSQFQTFDPLRTLHFLSKELQAKLSSMLPCKCFGKYFILFLYMLLAKNKKYILYNV